MWLHLRPVRRIMLTEVSSDDGSIVHPTTHPPALRPSHQSAKFRFQNFCQFFRILVSVSEKLVSDKKFRIMLTEVSLDDGSIVHPTSSQTLTQSGNGLISFDSKEILEILRKMITKKICALALQAHETHLKCAPHESTLHLDS